MKSVVDRQPEDREPIVWLDGLSCQSGAQGQKLKGGSPEPCSGLRAASYPMARQMPGTWENVTDSVLKGPCVHVCV